MPNRREFLQIGVAALALPICGQARFSAVNPAGSGIPSVLLYAVLFDARFAACCYKTVVCPRTASGGAVRAYPADGIEAQSV